MTIFKKWVGHVIDKIRSNLKFYPTSQMTAFFESMKKKIIKLNTCKFPFHAWASILVAVKTFVTFVLGKRASLWKLQQRASSSNGSKSVFHTLEDWIYLLYLMSGAAFTKVMHYSSISDCLILNHLLHVWWSLWCPLWNAGLCAVN